MNNPTIYTVFLQEKLRARHPHLNVFEADVIVHYHFFVDLLGGRVLQSSLLSNAFEVEMDPDYHGKILLLPGVERITKTSGELVFESVSKEEVSDEK